VVVVRIGSRKNSSVDDAIIDAGLARFQVSTESLSVGRGSTC
jgi:hypothetical protein